MLIQCYKKGYLTKRMFRKFKNCIARTNLWNRLSNKPLRPVNLIKLYLKIYKIFIHKNFTKCVNVFHSEFMSTSWPYHNSNDLLLRLIDKVIGPEKFVGVVIKHLSKTSNSTKHNLPIAKIHVYGFSIINMIMIMINH